MNAKWWTNILFYTVYHHHQVHEGLGVFPVPWSSKWSWSLHLFFGHPMFLRPFGLYCNACFGILFLSILCTSCIHFFWYCFISSTVFCAPVFSLIHWFFSLSNILHIIKNHKTIMLFRVRDIAVGWGTALKAGRSRVRYPMVSLQFFIDIIPPAALRHRGRPSV